MQRRQFLAASIAASAAAVTGQAQSPAPTSQPREFYQLRRYNLVSGSQSRLTEHYFSGALIPALGRMGLSPVGAFRLVYGPETPAYYLVIPASSVETLVTLDLTLPSDPEFMTAAAPFWNATSTAPAFQRVESWLLSAFPGWPRITPPPAAATKAKRIFQIRTYESPSHQDHVRKVEMFHSGEFAIFKAAGCQQVFFGDTLIGSGLPSLTYMLSFAGMSELEAGWNLFNTNPDWKKLSSDPRFTSDSIVSNVSDIILNPLGCSQI